MRKHTFWVVKLLGSEYFDGDTFGQYPYSTFQVDAAKFLTKELAEAAIGPRVYTGLVKRDSLTVHRLYREVPA